MKRREMLQMSAGTLLAAGLWPGRLEASANTESNTAKEWSFLAINDLHFDEAACGPWFARIVEAMKKSCPAAPFCLIGGDQADDGQLDQLRGARQAFEGLGIPFYTTPGNHDYAVGDDRSAYDQVFPGQLNQMFEQRGWQFVGLDSSDGTRYENTRIHPTTLEWIGKNLPQLDRKKPTVLWTHFPLGAGVKYRPLNADALLEPFLPFNVQATLSGHWHGFTQSGWQHAVQTTNRCCSRVRSNHDGTTRKGWFVCTLSKGTLTRHFVEIPLELRA